MKRPELSSLFLLICLSVCARSSIGDTPLPNIVIVLADDLGYADLACYGNRFNETPSIDRMASRGMRFTHFYAGPVCSPTRANLQSGLDQARFGITQHIPGHHRPYAKLLDPTVPHQLPSETITFAERLSAQGYTTGYFGKWHLGGEGFGPGDQGWQSFEETHGNSRQEKGNGKETSRMARYLTERATDFIASHKDTPFLLQVSHNAVHIPLSTSKVLLDKYRSKPSIPEYPSNPEYAGLVEELDNSVEAIISAVEQYGLAERTLIVFLSDNGGLEHEQGGTVVTSNSPLRGEKGTLYEGGIRIPAIWYWPNRIQPGSICEVPAMTLDLSATLADLSGSPLAANETDGVSLVSLLDNPSEKLNRDALYWHLPHYHHSTPASSMRKGDWKLLEFFEDSSLELYNLKSDPSEKNNLALREPAIAQDMLSMLQSWRQQVNARMPVANPAFDPTRAHDLGKGSDRKSKKK